MSSYLTLIGILLLVIFPVLLPLIVGGVRVVANLFVTDHRSTAASQRARRR